jgi:ABC-2 type transport system ATP-binding protein
MRNLLKQLGDGGKTIIVSSHILPELSDVCNKIGIIHRGQMKVNAAVADVMKQIRTAPVLHITVRERLEDAARLLETDPNVSQVEHKGNRLVVTLTEGTTDISPLASTLVQNGFQLTEFREDQPSLEAAFMMLTKGM